VKVYLAGSGWDKLWIKHLGGDDFYDFNRLETFWAISKHEAEVIHKYNNFMLDSGAFSFFGGAKTELDEYVTSYIDFINKYDVKHFFELDIYQLIGKEKTDIINQRIEKETGKQTIPVFHFFLGVDYYKQLCEKYKYIAISASGMFASAWTRQSPEKLRKLIDYAHTKGVKVHGLGYTKMTMLSKMPFDSVDSTSWIGGNRFGMVFEWLGTKFIKHKREGKNVKTNETARHNFYEWVKFSRYAEKNY
tara:strand:+ start:11474 stop:12214 length:741 start_codon:yes stop_codon:yes gene_type:complete